MTPKPKQPRRRYTAGISDEEMASLMAKWKKKETDSFLDKILSVGKVKTTPKLSKPDTAGSTDSSQRMVDFTEARRMGLPAGDVDKYRSR